MKSEETIHSAEKKLPHMKAFSLCIDKKNEKPNNQKQKNKMSIFQLRQFSIFFSQKFHGLVLGLVGLFDA